jgi:PRTRC genetic system protein A
VNPKDTILQELTPAVPVPRFEALPPDPRLEGHRFLVAQDGLWVEVQGAWLHARAPISASAIRLPFGEVVPVLELRCGSLPKALLGEFIARARQASPNETAAIITWREDSGEFRLVPVSLDAGPAHVRYERPRLSAGEYLVADLHSHGALPAGFSKQDDVDDHGEIKIAVVIGRCDTESPQVAARLCLLGLYLPFPQMGPTAQGDGAPANDATEAGGEA